MTEPRLTTTASSPAPKSRLTAVLAAALVVALVALAVTGWAWNEQRVAQKSAEQAEAAATAAAEHMTSYDYRSLDEDFAWITQDGTPKFAESFEAASQPVKEAITRLKAHADGKVTASAVTLTDPEHAEVLLFVDQTISDASSDEDKLDRTRVQMKMVHQDGRWLVDELALL